MGTLVRSDRLVPLVALPGADNSKDGANLFAVVYGRALKG